jgi:hypothetical protein
VLERTTLADLEYIERQEFGQRLIADRVGQRPGPGARLEWIDAYPEIQ